MLSAYACLVAAAQIGLVAAGPVASACCDAVIVLVLMSAYAIEPDTRPADALLLLTLVPLTRLISLSLPRSDLSALAREALVSGTLLVALGAAVRLVAIDWTPLRLLPSAWRQGVRPGRAIAAQLLIALCGIPVGLLGDRVHRFHPLATPSQHLRLVAAVAILALLSAPVLELVFRWALQQVALELMGPRGLVLVSVLYAGMYAGTRSAGYVALMGAVALSLGSAVARTGSVWGAIAAHVLIDVGVLVVWPAVL
jgi:membrane protease YdiL (CAAX protease family)